MASENRKHLRLKVQVWIYTRVPEIPHPLFLLLKTRLDRGEFWQPVTGGVEAGETVLNAALREAREETGLVFASTPDPIGGSFTFECRGETVEEQGFGLSFESCFGKAATNSVRSKRAL